MNLARSQSFLHDLRSNALARAFLLSLLLHFLVIGGVELGRSLGFWKTSLFSRTSPSRLVEEVLKKAEEKRQQQQEPPETQMVFIEVDPTQAAPEPPPKARHYSTHNTLAANPEIRLESETPKIDGAQDKVAKTMDTLQPNLQPAPPQPQKQSQLTRIQPKSEPPPPQPAPDRPQPPETPERKPPEAKEGELVVAKASPPPRPEPERPPAEPKRPRTIAQAKAQKGIIEGQKMKQEGGVQRHSISSSMNVRATPFGAYDAAFIAAVQARWFSLLDERDYVGNQAGRVVLEFRLTAEGRISEMRVAESEVSELLSWLCQRAVLDPAPYGPFPPDLKRLLKNDFREVRFTFYYNQ